MKLQKKACRIICVRNINFFIARPPFYYIICYFLCLLPTPSLESMNRQNCVPVANPFTPNLHILGKTIQLDMRADMFVRR